MMTLEAWRRERGLTFEQLADLLGLTGKGRGRTAQRYAKGERFPDPPTLLRIRVATDGLVTADDFVDQHTTPPDDDPPPDGGFPPPGGAAASCPTPDRSEATAVAAAFPLARSLNHKLLTSGDMRAETSDDDQ